MSGIKRPLGMARFSEPNGSAEGELVEGELNRVLGGCNSVSWVRVLLPCDMKCEIPVSSGAC